MIRRLCIGRYPHVHRALALQVEVQQRSVSPGGTAACARAAECACSCVRCDRERRQERRLGDQWQRDDHHVLLVLQFATREQRSRKAQSHLCQHALQRDSTALGLEKHKARRLAAALRESGVLQRVSPRRQAIRVHCRHKR